MKSLLVGATLFIAAGGSAHAQSAAAKPGTASIEGDVYLVMKSGDTKKGAGLTVYLLQLSADTRSVIPVTCQAEQSSYKRAGDEFDRKASDFRAAAAKNASSEVLRGLLDEMKAARRRADAAPLHIVEEMRVDVDHSKVDSARTGMNAHYKFSGVRPGSYVLLAQWPIGDHPYEWWVPVDVASGPVAKDLDHTLVSEDPLTARCTPRR